MYKALASILLLPTLLVKADTDPCERDDYPIKWQLPLTNATTYSLPAIYYEHENSKIIVSVSNAFEITQKNMAEHKSYLKAAKLHILNTLQQLPKGALVNSSQLWIPTQGLEDDSLNKAIHVMAGYQFLFEYALFNKRAVVEVDNQIIENTTAKHTVGKDQFPLDDLEIVHKTVIFKNRNIVFSKCWLDRR